MSHSKYDIAGRTVFVTGAARGIGAASAERLHSKGANVALVGLEPDKLEQLAERLGDRAAAFEANVADADALQQAVDGTVERFGGIDVAIANAGIAYVGAVATSPVDQIERTLEVNLQGVVRTNLAVLPQVIERKGYLLNVASLAAASHAPLMAAYAASKAGVEAWSNSLRVELAPSGARVGCAYFGFIDTDLVRGARTHPATTLLEKEAPAFMNRSVPLPKAVDVIERGIERRAGRIWAPRWVGVPLAVRGVFQPLLERRTMRSAALPEALRLADPASGAGEAQETPLGAAAAALDEPAPASARD